MRHLHRRLMRQIRDSTQTPMSCTRQERRKERGTERRGGGKGRERSKVTGRARRGRGIGRGKGMGRGKEKRVGKMEGGMG